MILYRNSEDATKLIELINKMSKYAAHKINIQKVSCVSIH